MTRRPVGAILAGGRAERFGGSAKGLLHVDGIRIVDRVASALRPLTSGVAIVGSGVDPAWLPDARVVVDLRANAGPLGGIHAALVHASSPVLVVAWDMPFVTTPLLAALCDASRDDVDAVVPMSASGAEPLCAWYGPRCVPAIERMLDAGVRSARGLAAEVNVAWLRDVERFGDPARLFASVNSPADLARLGGAAQLSSHDD